MCKNFHAIGTTLTTHIREYLAKIHRIIDPSKASEPSMPIRDVFATQGKKLQPTTAETLEARRKKVRKALLN